MSEFFVIGVDQSTQGTKAVLFDDKGEIIARHDERHKQYISDEGWVSHDPEEIYNNVIKACSAVICESGIDRNRIRTIGISNQRETTLAWNRENGMPYAKAVVWHCNRAEKICDEIAGKCDPEKDIYRVTGIKLTPYYPASKMAWLLRYVDGLAEDARNGKAALGTMDSWLVYKLTHGQNFYIDFSNASRTQLMNLNTLTWDPGVCDIFGIPIQALPTIIDSDSDFGETDLEGILPHKVPIHGVLGDSHAALFGHNCRNEGGIKATYGTGSSVMLNTGSNQIKSQNGLTTSVAWKVNGKVDYVLEGNINYTGAVFSWLKDDVHLIASTSEIEEWAAKANDNDTTYLIPAFSGLGAPWWADNAKAAIIGMTRNTGKAEIIRAGCESIAFQINDIVEAMRHDTGLKIQEMCVDGGPTRNNLLMQEQSDFSNLRVKIPHVEELSALGAAYLAGMATGLYDQDVYRAIHYKYFECQMGEERRKAKIEGWKSAVRSTIKGKEHADVRQ